MKVFKSKEFIDKLKWLVNDVPNYYHSENGTWCNYNSSNGKFMMDCVVSIKGLLWGFKADKNKPHGGAIYGSNGVADFGANQGINYCDGVSRDFHNLIPGEYLCMKDTPYSHAGVYIGNGKVFECTTGWGVNKCIISDIDEKGGRYYKGKRNLTWTYHGRLKYIDYSGEPEPPSPKPEPDYTGVITYQSYNGSWQPEVHKCDNTDDGYAGLKTVFMSGLRAKPQYGEIFIQSHNLNGSWNEEVSSKNYSSGGYNSYSGILGTPIDMIKMRSTKGHIDFRVLVQDPKTKNIYWLDWVDSRTISGTESYAGIPGYIIMGIQMK